MQQKTFSKYQGILCLNTIVSKNVSVNTLTNVTKEFNTVLCLIVEGGCNKMLRRENCWGFCSKFAK